MFAINSSTLCIYSQMRFSRVYRRCEISRVTRFVQRLIVPASRNEKIIFVRELTKSGAVRLSKEDARSDVTGELVKPTSERAARVVM